MKIDIKFSVTDSASNQLKSIFPEGSLVRISARPSGCSKTIYGLGTTSSAAQGDIVEEISGVVFVADRSSLLRLDGVALDWISREGEEGFVFSEDRPPSVCCSDNSSGKCCRKNSS